MESLHNPSISINLTMPDGETTNIKDKSGISPVTVKGARPSDSIRGEQDAPGWGSTFGWRNESPVGKDGWSSGAKFAGYRDLDEERRAGAQKNNDTSLYASESAYQYVSHCRMAYFSHC